MKRMMICGVAVMAFASPALALRVTNLDKVPHTVQLAGAGEAEVHEIAPDDTEYFTSSTGGYLSLMDAQHPKPSKGTLHSDGVLSGVVGAARTENIPADPDNNYAIWPGGKLSLQNRIKKESKY